ncbi:c-type cytochrome [Hyphococcus luteus]|uniref:Cytochrome c domain-containing protein n=1 Tax=Hyphococcus luteus TaxID=2058213 RepID=A0A2S7K0P3_9PROT|nr:cytochrome c [Marinicaulis flavus]PQA86077.1 hypothetical protein CW354_17045 [Marinicaulis flavus]
MSKILFAARFGFAAAAALALAGCGGKEEAAPAPEAGEDTQVQEAAAPARPAPEEAPAEEAKAGDNSELTKVSSQAAAAEQARGVFTRARSGDPEAVYLARCQYCHIELGPGTITLARRMGPEQALLANRTDLTGDYIKTVVRNGLNTMPPLTRVEVSDEDLDLIVQYLTRNNEEAAE